MNSDPMNKFPDDNITQRSGDKKCNNLRTRNNTFKTMFCSLTDCKFSYLTLFSPLQFHLPVDDILFPVDLNRCRHTYNDYQAPSTLIPIAFSFLIQTYPRLHVAYSNRIRLSTRIWWHPPKFTLEKLRPTRCVAILVYCLGKRMYTVSLRHWIRKYPDWSSTPYRIHWANWKIGQDSGLDSGLDFGLDFIKWI